MLSSDTFLVFVFIAVKIFSYSDVSCPKIVAKKLS